jgi:hypothetical protein
VGAETTDILAGDGTVLASLRYLGDGAAAAATALSILGAPSERLYTDATGHTSAADGYRWGSFQLWVRQASEGSVPDEWFTSPYLPRFSVYVDGQSTDSGVTIAAADGSRVGGSYRAATAGKDPILAHVDPTFGSVSVVLDLPTSFPGLRPEPGFSIPHGTIAWAEPDSDQIRAITAPFDLYTLY